MRILISHCSYPAQFRRLAPELASQGHQVVFLHQQREWHAPEPGAVQLVSYQAARSQDPAACHPYLRRLETAVCQGQAAYRAARALQENGFAPDLILSHAGFGSGLFLKDAFPHARRIGLFEWYYNAHGSDVDFLQNGVIEANQQLRLRSWNAQLLLELVDCDRAVVPTRWQKQQFPDFLQPRLSQVHEGVDVEQLKQLRRNQQQRPAWMPQGDGLELVTYVSRGFEEYRGFPQAMQALALVQQQRPNAHILIAGSDVVCYGKPRNDGRSWREWAQQDCGLEPTRTHWLGPLGSEDYKLLLAMTDAHLYLTIPFVLSWSLLEAMAAGCPIVASATAPVEEVIDHNVEGVLANFWEPKAIADALAGLLNNPTLGQALGRKAQGRAQAFSAEAGLRGWTDLIDSLS